MTWDAVPKQSWLLKLSCGEPPPLTFLGVSRKSRCVCISSIAYDWQWLSGFGQCVSGSAAAAKRQAGEGPGGGGGRRDRQSESESFGPTRKNFFLFCKHAKVPIGRSVPSRLPASIRSRVFTSSRRLWRLWPFSSKRWIWIWRIWW